MSTFDGREDAFEKQFAHDEELRFKAHARRNKLIGLWAAEKLGKSGPEADAYASGFAVAVDEDVFLKVRKDFDAAGVSQSDHQIRRNHGRPARQGDGRDQDDRLIRAVVGTDRRR